MVSLDNISEHFRKLFSLRHILSLSYFHLFGQELFEEFKSKVLVFNIFYLQKELFR